MQNTTTTMNKKGKITIPATIRKQENYKPGQKFSFLKSIDGLILIPLNSEEIGNDSLISIDQLQKICETSDELELKIESLREENT
ncbi:AbrB/MazE/SpoVT family DNA-binding domain-containing protein [Candidatus Lokiarchaeum ossiferum]|uniref:AbrB/MazE/SpoVT family DNA-binding domain-containing protein n=1 Tax=Candidatus Lokiarchaeum ossiferum TaxID=2951803 RepID=UPI00352E8A1F